MEAYKNVPDNYWTQMVAEFDMAIAKQEIVNQVKNAWRLKEDCIVTQIELNILSNDAVHKIYKKVGTQAVGDGEVKIRLSDASPTPQGPSPTTELEEVQSISKSDQLSKHRNAQNSGSVALQTSQQIQLNVLETTKKFARSSPNLKQNEKSNSKQEMAGSEMRLDIKDSDNKVKSIKKKEKDDDSSDENSSDSFDFAFRAQQALFQMNHSEKLLVTDDVENESSAQNGRENRIYSNNTVTGVSGESNAVKKLANETNAKIEVGKGTGKQISEGIVQKDKNKVNGKKKRGKKKKERKLKEKEKEKEKQKESEEMIERKRETK